MLIAGAAKIGRLTETVEIKVSANLFPEDPAATIGRIEDPAAVGRLTGVATIGRLTEVATIDRLTETVEIKVVIE